MSEIAGRLGKPATSLTRPLANLIQLGYIRKDVPFGASARSGKKTIYRIEDPFITQVMEKLSDHAEKFPKIDGVVKTWTTVGFVIPAQAGI